MEYEEAKIEFQSLKTPPVGADKKWFQQRGHNFETLFNAFLDHEKMEPRLRYRPDGEELDGSFFAFEQHFLLELKWHEKPIEASALYAFKGKVDGKLIGTIGIFISMSGYSKDAVDALIKGKELNIILFDNKDIDFALSNSFANLLKAKLRAAADEGNLYLRSENMQILKPAKDIPTAQTVIQTVSSSVNDTFCFICEGKTDQIILQELLAKTITYFFEQSKNKNFCCRRSSEFN